MSIKTYIADSSNKLYDVSHSYENRGQYTIYASDNIADVRFTTDESNFEQAG